MKLALAAAFLSLAAALTGCSTPSLNALASDDTTITDEGLAGTWIPQGEGKKESKERYIITAGDDKNYDLKIEKNDKDSKDMSFSLKLVKLGEHTFVDLTVSEADREEIGDRWGTTAAPMHNFMKLKRDGDTLQVWPIEDKNLEKSLKDGTLKLDHALYGDDKQLVLTASTKDLQAFFTKHADNKDLYNDPGILKRRVEAK